MNNKPSLTDLLSETGYFHSIHDVKILSHLVQNPFKDTVKDICDEIGLPDSKVYPSLKQLVTLGVIFKDSSHRPAKYSFTNPRTLEDFLDNQFTSEISAQKTKIENINKLVVDFWDPTEPELGQIAYLYRGNSIFNEILRLMKNSTDKLVLILADDFEPFTKILIDEIPKLTSRGVKVELAVPNSFSHSLKPLLQSSPRLLKIKSSLTVSNSYLVRDQKTMLNIIHRRQESVAMLTNDPLLVEYIDSCWNNDSCCINGTFLLENENVISLEVIRD